MLLSTSPARGIHSKREFILAKTELGNSAFSPNLDSHSSKNPKD